MNLPELLALVDGYHITDKGLLRSRARMDSQPSESAERDFRKHALRYFATLAREAEAHLANVDSRLDDVYQRQYNLQAERAVTPRRLDGARTVMRALEET
jgi:hypothetical protein